MAVKIPIDLARMAGGEFVSTYEKQARRDGRKAKTAAAKQAAGKPVKGQACAMTAIAGLSLALGVALSTGEVFL